MWQFLFVTIKLSFGKNGVVEKFITQRS